MEIRLAGVKRPRASARGVVGNAIAQRRKRPKRQAFERQAGCRDLRRYLVWAIDADGRNDLSPRLKEACRKRRIQRVAAAAARLFGTVRQDDVIDGEVAAAD